MVGFYTTCFDLAKNVMECLAAIGGLPADFFVRAHSGENVTLRLLYYPEGGNRRSSRRSPHRLRANDVTVSRWCGWVAG